MTESLEESEFQKALQEAGDQAYNEYLFGGRKEAKKAEKLPPEILKALKDAERIKRESESLKRRAENQMRGMGAAMGGFGWKPPTLPTLSANPSIEEIESYRAEVDAYAEQVRNESQRLRDETIQRGMKSYAERNPTLKTGLRCPTCGDPDNGNLMDKTPYCLKCNVALVRSDEKPRKKQLKIKAIDKSKVPNILRGLPEV